MLPPHHTRHTSRTPNMPHPHLPDLNVNQCQTLNVVPNAPLFCSMYGSPFLLNMGI